MERQEPDRRIRRRGGRRRDERGAALVEFAIVMPLLFLILFGIVEFGIAFNDYQSIRQGAREGARQAVVGESGTSVDCGINGPAQTAPNGAKWVICSTKDRTGLGDDVRVAVVVVDNAPAGWKNDSITVCSVLPVESITGLFGPFIDGRQLRTKVVMRVEKDADLPPGSHLETDPSGDGWTWC